MTPDAKINEAGTLTYPAEICGGTELLASLEGGHQSERGVTASLR